MSKKDLHVVPHKNGWAAVREGAERASLVGSTKLNVLADARDLARKDKVELVIHKKNGRIQDRDSYGNDPRPPIDKKH